MPDVTPIVCTMCEEAPATTTRGFPVCQPCADWLTVLNADLTQMEAEDPALAEAGRRVDEAIARFEETRNQGTGS